MSGNANNAAINGTVIVAGNFGNARSFSRKFNNNICSDSLTTFSVFRIKAYHDEVIPCKHEAATALILFYFAIVMMIGSWSNDDRGEKFSKVVVKLIRMDLGTSSYEPKVNQEPDQIKYEGIFHWHRDVIEKLLSLVSVLLFAFFVSRFIFYFIDLFAGNIGRLNFIFFDLNLILAAISFLLIIDGLMVVAAMTDAPGINKILDSIIVVLSGVTILGLDVRYSPETLVKINFNWQDVLLMALLGIVIGLLFLIKNKIQES